MRGSRIARHRNVSCIGPEIVASESSSHHRIGDQGDAGRRPDRAGIDPSTSHGAPRLALHPWQHTLARPTDRFGSATTTRSSGRPSVGAPSPPQHAYRSGGDGRARRRQWSCAHYHAGCVRRTPSILRRVRASRCLRRSEEGLNREHTRLDCKAASDGGRSPATWLHTSPSVSVRGRSAEWGSTW